MGELDVLRQRIEQADLRLRTAHSARERESAALREMWEQIRGRFAEQESELTALHARIAELEDSKDELLGMLRTLLAAVEDGVSQMRDETVPEIAAMAGELLGAEPDAPLAAAGVPDRLPDGSGGKAGGTASGGEDEAELEMELEGPVEIDFPEPAGESLSPGIRDLITRVEGGLANGAGAPDEDENDLARDLREIETLRNELDGLRARMSVDER